MLLGTTGADEHVRFSSFTQGCSRAETTSPRNGGAPLEHGSTRAATARGKVLQGPLGPRSPENLHQSSTACQYRLEYPLRTTGRDLNGATPKSISEPAGRTFVTSSWSASSRMLDSGAFTSRLRSWLSTPPDACPISTSQVRTTSTALAPPTTFRAPSAIQDIRYFRRHTDVALNVGLLVDTSGS